MIVVTSFVVFVNIMCLLTYGGGSFVYDVENIEKVLLSSYRADSWERYIGYEYGHGYGYGYRHGHGYGYGHGHGYGYGYGHGYGHGYG